MLAAVAWTIVFFAAYLRRMLHRPFRGAALTASEGWTRIALLAVLTGLVFAVDVTYPPGWFWRFIFVLKPAGVVLPTAVAIGTTIAITLLACCCSGGEIGRCGVTVTRVPEGRASSGRR